MTVNAIRTNAPSPNGYIHYLKCIINNKSNLYRTVVYRIVGVSKCRYPNIVAGLRDPPRLDCACHRLHTVFNDSYKETQNQCPKFKEHEDAVCILCKYVKQATGIQETLPVSIKHSGNTHPWTSIYRRSHSINKSYMKLSEKLTERGRLPFLAAVDKCLNDQVRDVAELFSDVFENLQYSTRPTINIVIPSYYKLYATAYEERPNHGYCIGFRL